MRELHEANSTDVIHPQALSTVWITRLVPVRPIRA